MSERAEAVNGEMLRWARERAAMSLDDVAKFFQKAPAEIESWESSDRYPTFHQLERLAEHLYHCPIAVFFFDEPPDIENPKAQFRTVTGAFLESLDPEANLALREASRYRESIRELGGGAGERRLITRDIRAQDLPPSDLPAEVRRYLGISVEAQTRWANKERALREWRNAVEEAGVFVFKRAFRGSALLGFSIHDPNAPLIVLNNSTAPGRQIFTLFHELGHLLYGISSVTLQDSAQLAVYLDARLEIACNQFASEFLLPRDEYRGDRQPGTELNEDVERVSRVFKVSREMVIIRMRERGAITQRELEEKLQQYSDEYLAWKEQRKTVKSGGSYYANLASYRGPAFLRLAFGAHDRGEIALHELANHLAISARQVLRLQEYLASRS